MNIQPFVEKNLLSIAAMDRDMMTTAVNISSRGVIDDGEVIPGAIAFHNRWLLVTDNLYTRTLFSQHLPELSSLSTIDIFKYWADMLCPGAQEIEDAVKSMYKRARYMPHTGHRWYHWWDHLRQNSSNMRGK
ncbi:hypothetical protein [Tengunoibacter tsumagoiensis]|uniref:hypothetical protein n=1 Tax=Tengunoibacter tsumagoiensis TaxID=2014871 RepID=UPI000F826486|nr:hypothetical protein [Tengunoibacter tsumagoiensis]